MTILSKIAEFFELGSKSKQIERSGKEHDFRRSSWGWAIQSSFFKEIEPGKYSTLGHGYGIKQGDWIRICTKQKPKEGRRYLVEDISYYRDPRDMFRIVILQDDFGE